MDTQSPREPGQITIAHGETVDRAEFAEFLRRTREQRQITLDQISDETKIAARHLAALERGDVRTWPGGMYRRAMMRAYAESIGLDRQYALEQFDRAFVQEPAAPPGVAPPAPEPPPAVHTARPPEPPFRWPSIRTPHIPRPRIALPAFSLPRAAFARISAAPAARRVVVAVAATAAVLAVALFLRPSSSGVRSDAERIIAADAPRAAAPVPAVVTAQAAPASAAAAEVTTARQASAAPWLPAAVATSGPTESAVATDAHVPAATEGQIVIASEPAGARVTINGVGWGDTPLTVRYLSLGSKRVRLTLPGYLSQEQVVQLGSDRPNARLSIALRPRGETPAERH